MIQHSFLTLSSIYTCLYVMGEQRRSWSAGTSVPSNQTLHCSLLDSQGYFWPKSEQYRSRSDGTNVPADPGSTLFAHDIKCVYTVKPVLKTTCKQRPPVDKDHILFVQLTDIKNKFTCEQRPSAFRDHFWVFPWVVFIDRFDCICDFIHSTLSCH
jgi:hypothetical protein